MIDILTICFPPRAKMQQPGLCRGKRRDGPAQRHGSGTFLLFSDRVVRHVLGAQGQLSQNGAMSQFKTKDIDKDMDKTWTWTRT